MDDFVQFVKKVQSYEEKEPPFIKRLKRDLDNFVIFKVSDLIDINDPHSFLDLFITKSATRRQILDLKLLLYKLDLDIVVYDKKTLSNEFIYEHGLNKDEVIAKIETLEQSTNKFSNYI